MKDLTFKCVYANSEQEEHEEVFKQEQFHDAPFKILSRSWSYTLVNDEFVQPENKIPIVNADGFANTRLRIETIVVNDKVNLKGIIFSLCAIITYEGSKQSTIPLGKINITESFVSCDITTALVNRDFSFKEDLDVSKIRIIFLAIKEITSELNSHTCHLMVSLFYKTFL